MTKSHSSVATTKQRTPLDDLEQLFASRVVIRDHERTAVCLWIAHTYVYDRFKRTPRLFITSLKYGAGKSSLMSLIADLSFKGKKFEAGTTLASIRDMKIASGFHTICLDQLDDFYSPGTPISGDDKQLANMICSGYELGAAIALKTSDKDGGWKNSIVDCGFPVALGKIGEIKNAALVSRCITIHLHPETPAERTAQLEERGKPLPSDLTERLAGWAAAVQNTSIRAPKGTESRTEDLWQPLLNVARLAGPEWEEKALQAIVAFNDPTARPEGKEVRLLRRVVDAVQGMEGQGIYSTLLDLKLSVAEGAELTPVARGLMLKRVGLEAKSRIWETGKKQAKGYAFDDIQRAAAAYLPSAPLEDAA